MQEHQLSRETVLWFYGSQEASAEPLIDHDKDFSLLFLLSGSLLLMLWTWAEKRICYARRALVKIVRRQIKCVLCLVVLSSLIWKKAREVFYGTKFRNWYAEILFHKLYPVGSLHNRSTARSLACWDALAEVTYTIHAINRFLAENSNS